MLIEGKKAKANRVVLDAAGTMIMILIIQIFTLVGEVRHQAATPEYWGQQFEVAKPKPIHCNRFKNDD